VFLDTEGTASYEQTEQSSATIVLLAGLVSSLMIYNKQGTFDENCVKSLASAALILEKLYSAKGTVHPQDGTCVLPRLHVIRPLLW
jgi:hypothetical protein